eukprot:6427603-Amphidinium_carterae.1
MLVSCVLRSLRFARKRYLNSGSLALLRLANSRVQCCSSPSNLQAALRAAAEVARDAAVAVDH